MKPDTKKKRPVEPRGQEIDSLLTRAIDLYIETERELIALKKERGGGCRGNCERRSTVAITEKQAIFKSIADQFPAQVPPDDYQFEFIFGVKLDYRDWRVVLAALQSASVSATASNAFVEAALRFAKAHAHADYLDSIYDEHNEGNEDEYEAADREYNESKKALVAVYKATPPDSRHQSTKGDSK